MQDSFQKIRTRLNFKIFRTDVADALKTRAFCALSASSPSDGSSIALASHAVQALESYESQEMRLVSASALLRLKLCRAELQNLCCKEKDATLEEEENTTPLGRGEHDNELSDPDTNNKMMIVSRVKNAFHTQFVGLETKMQSFLQLPSSTHWQTQK